MILNTLANFDRYLSLHPDFAAALNFLRRSDLAALPPGRHAIDGDRLYAMVARDPGRTRAAAACEGHRRYLDLQLVLAGDEEMGWRPRATCRTVKTAYDTVKDIEFWSDSADTWIRVPPGSLAVFFPDDAHAPMVGSGPIHKVIVKVAVGRQ